MQTRLAEFVKVRPEHDELDRILRTCVHCGFCNATCPTYLLAGNELDGPRGRIYLLKQMLEGQAVSKLTQRHLDRCLSCRACETTCPSGVRYGRLYDLGRVMVDEKVGRPILERIKHGLIRAIFPYRQRFKYLIQIAGLLKPLLPDAIKQKLVVQQGRREWHHSAHQRKMLVLPGCVQSTLAPGIDTAAAKVLDKLGITLQLVATGGCCGAINYHLFDHAKALAFARKNIDACWPYIEQGAEAIVMTASGCGVMVKEYGALMNDDENYRDKAATISKMTKDISEILLEQDLTVFNAENLKVAFQSPCTLQHGQKLTGVVETILRNTGYQLTSVEDGHLCCGSAGTYSLLQPEFSGQLLDRKLAALEANKPDVIATANIGCLTHLQSKSSTPVRHWIELLENL